MFVTRVEADRPTVVPPQYRAAPALRPGDRIAIERISNRIVIVPMDDAAEPFVGFASVAEWAGDEDARAFDGL